MAWRFNTKRADQLRAAAVREDARGAAAKATALWRELAEAGDVEACHEMGLRHERGSGVIQSFPQAVSWFESAADRGLVKAQSKLGEIYMHGRGASLALRGPAAAAQPPKGALAKLFPDGGAVKPDLEKAARWNGAAAQGGDTAAQVRIAYQCAAGLGISVDLAQAEHWLAAAAAKQDPAGEFGLGMLHAGGHGGTPDPEKAAVWFERAADHGNTSAQLCLALLLMEGRGVSKDEGRAAQLFTQAAEGGQPEAMYRLGHLYRYGHGVPVSAEAAETWLRRAVARGHVGAMVVLAYLLAEAVPPEFLSASQLFRQAADLGHPQAQYALGRLYLHGRGVPNDPAQAAVWFAKAADQGVVGAYGQLGGLYADGVGVEQDLAAAADWFQRAADEGDDTALYHIGALHYGGLGVPKDPAAAAGWYRQAAERGNAEACLRLGIMYALGDGLEQDYAAAAVWYARASELGNLHGRWNLAFLNLRGCGVPLNVGAGLRLLESAALNGSQSAAWALHNLYTEGVMVAADPDAATDWLDRVAEMGSGVAACRLLERLEGGDERLGIERVVELLTQSANAGEPNAQVGLARLYYEGKLVERDSGAALRWFVAAADAGNAFAQAWMGDVLLTGQGVLVDRVAARHWYRKAAGQGHVGAIQALSQPDFQADAPDDGFDLFACWMKAAEAGETTAQRVVGELFLRGSGTPKDTVAAVKWLRLAVAGRNSAAMGLLAAAMLGGEAESAYPLEPIDLLNRAADLGNADAIYNLGVCHRRGLRIEPDIEIAKSLYRKASNLDQSSAQLALADILCQPGASETDLAEALLLYSRAAGADIPQAAVGLQRLRASMNALQAL